MNRTSGMTETERIELAKAYVALSNAHRVDLIVPMFADDAVYWSTNVGEFRGARSIGEIMSLVTGCPDGRGSAES